jgi:hypothetical protein
MHKTILIAMILALSLALGGCVAKDWFGSKPELTQVLEKARQVGHGDATLDELKGLALRADLGTGEAGRPEVTSLAMQYQNYGTAALCAFDTDGNDKLSDDEMLNIIAAWIRDGLKGQDVLTAVALWIDGAPLECEARLDYGVELDRTAARDAAIEYIHNSCPDSGIPLDAEWEESDITPPDLVGSAVFLYTIAGAQGSATGVYHPLQIGDNRDMAWRILVRYPVVTSPDYRVEVTNLDWPHPSACLDSSCGYWQVTVSSAGEVAPIPPTQVEGIIIVAARNSRSESWGIRVTDGPKEYIGKEVGLKSYIEMKPYLKDHEGELFTADAYKFCRPFDRAELCCGCVFEFCAPFLDFPTYSNAW